MVVQGKSDDVVRFADMFSAIATEARLRILRLLLSAHPEGMVVGEIVGELGIPASTLSHHLEKLKNGRASGTPRLSLRRVLHAEQGHRPEKIVCGR